MSEQFMCSIHTHKYTYIYIFAWTKQRVTQLIERCLVVISIAAVVEMRDDRDLRARPTCCAAVLSVPATLLLRWTSPEQAEPRKGAVTHRFVHRTERERLLFYAAAPLPPSAHATRLSCVGAALRPPSQPP